jgi:hypothetical protein
MPKHITKEMKETLVSYYKSKPMTLDRLVEVFNISMPSVIKVLNEYHVKRYSKVRLFSPDLKESYFETIDTECKAYFLGLIITDGCIHSAKGRQPLVSLTLQKSDAYLLEKLKEELNSNKRVTGDGRGCCSLSILSSKMVADLKQYGVVPNKSLSVAFPKNIPKQFYRHFIRGVLDGDGSVSYYSRAAQGRKSHTKAVRFCKGSRQFLEDLVEFLFVNVGIKRVSLYREKDNLWSIAYRENYSMLKLIDYMYNDAHVYMERKKRLCDLVYAEAYKYGSAEITKGNKDPMVS